MVIPKVSNVLLYNLASCPKLRTGKISFIITPKEVMLIDYSLYIFLLEFNSYTFYEKYSLYPSIN